MRNHELMSLLANLPPQMPVYLALDEEINLVAQLQQVALAKPEDFADDEESVVGPLPTENIIVLVPQ